MSEQKISILQEAEEIINGERARLYGSVTENFSRIAAGWTEIIGKEVTAEQVGLCMVWLKIARQVNMQHRDNLVDGAGYFGTLEKLGRGE